MDGDQSKLIGVAQHLKERVEAQRVAHYRAGDHLRVLHYTLGLLLILISALVSGSVLQASGDNPSQALTLTAGALSVAVVVLTSVQTTFKLGERSEQHRSAAVGFGGIARKLEVFVNRGHADIEAAWTELTAIEKEIDNVEAGAPGFHRRTYEAALEQVRAEG
jgi:hypothetical protein